MTQQAVNLLIMQTRILIALLLTSFTFPAISADSSVDQKAKLEKTVQIIQDDLDLIVDKGGRYAYKQLTTKGGVSPFAIGVTNERNFLILRPENNKDVGVQAKVLELRRLLQEAVKKGNIVAAAVFVGAKVPVASTGQDKDGVAIELEHGLGISTLRFLPYELDQKNKKLKFETPLDKIKPAVFFKETPKA